MSIKLSKNKRYFTGSNLLTCGQDRCGVQFRFRYEGDPDRSGALHLFDRGPYLGPRAVCKNPSGGRIQVQHVWRTTGPDVSATAWYLPGVDYHVLMAFDQGSQVLYVNGVPAVMGSVSLKTMTFPGKSIYIGGSEYTLSDDTIFRIDDVAIWHDYAPTASDAKDLRDGLKDPEEVGPLGTLAAHWSLDGSIGSVPAVGDVGLLGIPGPPLSGTDGAGTALYGIPIRFEPAVDPDMAYVSTCRKLIGMQFRSIATGALAQITEVFETPAIARNGLVVGTGRDTALASGMNTRILFAPPKGVEFAPGDHVAISARDGWAMSDQGLVAGFQDLPLEDFGGRSCFGTDGLRKTLQVGMNIAWNGTGHEYCGPLLKDLSKRLGGIGQGGKNSPDGFPILMTQDAHQQAWYDYHGDYGPLGLFAAQWDVLDPNRPIMHRPRASGWPQSALVTERVDLQNPGRVQPDGTILGMARVWEIAQNPAVANSRRTIVWEVYTPKPGPLPFEPKYANLVIHGPGDFDYKDNTPVVLDNSKPLSVSKWALDRFSGCGTVRPMDPVSSNGGSFSGSEFEHMVHSEDRTWSYSDSKMYRRVEFSGVLPYSRATVPFVYHSSVGSRYTVELAEPIDLHQDHFAIKDSKDAPAFAMQRLFMDGEEMRIESMDGNVATVTRHTNGTIPARHPAGTVGAGYRYESPTPEDMTVGNGVAMVLKCTAPHGLWSGCGIQLDGRWPPLPLTDGTTLDVGGFSGTAYVTGPDTLAVAFYNPKPFGTTLSGPVALAPGCGTLVRFGGPMLPYEFVASMAGEVGCKLHLNVAALLSEDCVRRQAYRVLEEYPGDLDLLLETSNEVWNWGFSQYRYFTLLSRTLFGLNSPYPAMIDVHRTHLRIFREVFATRGRAHRVKSVLAFRPFPGMEVQQTLDYCKTLSPPYGPDFVSIAPYLTAPTFNDPAGEESLIACQDRYDADQNADLWIHQIRTSTKRERSYDENFRVVRAAIDSYNAATGATVKMNGYEGGMQAVLVASVVVPGRVSATSGSPAVVGSGTRFLDFFAPGKSIRILDSSNQWRAVAIAAVADQTHLTLASPWTLPSATGRQARMDLDNYQEKTRDIIRSPAFRQAELETYAMFQPYFDGGISVFAYAGPWYQNVYMWAIYGWPFQEHGKGDGSDGKFDNRLWMCQPGLPGTKPSGSSEYERVVSTRGQAMWEWNREAYRCPTCGQPWPRGG